MKTRITKNRKEIIMELCGRLDTNAAVEVTEELNDLLAGDVKRFVLDMRDCDYVASSGLRAILGAQKKMNSLQGTMVVKNVSGDVMEVFDMTGFSDILTFE
jgi:anti-sigma B factor antagonist